MPTTYNIASNPQWVFADPSGKPAVGYIWATWRDVARDEPKLVYQDNLGNFPYPQSIALNAAGQVSIDPIFFASDENYYITVTAPGSSEPLYAFQNFNATSSGGGGGEEFVPMKNLLVNGQFTFVSNPLINYPPGSTLSLGPGWYFVKNNNSAFDFIAFPKFLPGQTQIMEGNPIQQFEYSCTTPGSGELTKYLYQSLNYVTSLENQMISLQFQAKSPVNSTISVNFIQNFGTGGSPTVVTPFIGSPIILNNTYSKYELSLTVPSTGGFTIGGGSYVAIAINFPLNATSDVLITNVQLVLGEIQYPYDYNSNEIELSRSYTGQYPQPQQEIILNMCQGFSDLFRPIIYTGENTFSYEDVVPVGSPILVSFDVTIITESNPNFPLGYFIANGRGLDGYANNFQYRRLALYYGNTYGYGNDGIFGSQLGAQLQFTNVLAGVVTPWVDVTTGFAISIISSSPNMITQVVCNAGSTITAGAYFYAFGVSSQWYIWYIIDGVGVDPEIAGKIGIPVPISASFSATQVATITKQQIVLARFGTPNLNNGIFIRGGFSGAVQTYDPNASTRLPYINSAIGGTPGGNIIGTLQMSQNLSHTHTTTTPSLLGLTFGTGTLVFESGTNAFATNAIALNNSGGLQSNPNNIMQTVLLKY